MREEMLPAGKKAKFERQYPLSGGSKANGSNIILRLISLDRDEKTEYSLKNTGSSWKVLL
jgi:hypothetical protein